jgi:uncharacterized membrane protein YfcA
MDLQTILYAGFVLFLAYLVRGIAGFGSGLIAVPLLTLVSPVPVVVPLVVSLDYIGSASQGIKHRGHIAWKEQLQLVPCMLLGIGLGLFLLHALPTVVLSKVLGGFVILYALSQLLALPAQHYSRCSATVCGILGGLVGTLFGTGGPFYAIYLNLRDLDKGIFRATFAANFLLDGGIRLTAYALLGLLNQQIFVYLLAALPIMGAGLYLGGRLHTQFSQMAFVRFMSLLLLGSGLMLLLKQ